MLLRRWEGTYYKALRRVPVWERRGEQLGEELPTEKLRSYVGWSKLHPQDPVFDLEYSTEFVTTPLLVGSKLFAFEDLFEASLFVKLGGMSNSVLYECAVYGEPVRRSWFASKSTLAVRFWELVNAGREPSEEVACIPAQSGTVLVEGVRLLREVPLFGREE